MAVTVQSHIAFAPQAVTASSHPGIRPEGFKTRKQYASQSVAFTLDAQAGLKQLAAGFDRLPDATNKSLWRAMRKLARWLSRRVLQASAAASGVTQKGLVASHRSLDPQRIKVTKTPDGLGLRVWVGTSPIHAQYLGKPIWRPYRGKGSRPQGKPKRPGRGAGARVRNHLFVGTYSWGEGSKTGRKVMIRTGRRDAYRDADGHSKEGVTEPLYDLVHAPVKEWLGRLQIQANARFDTLLRQELNYALKIEAQR